MPFDVGCDVSHSRLQARHMDLGPDRAVADHMIPSRGCFLFFFLSFFSDTALKSWAADNLFKQRGHPVLQVLSCMLQPNTEEKD